MQLKNVSRVRICPLHYVLLSMSNDMVIGLVLSVQMSLIPEKEKTAVKCTCRAGDFSKRL